VLPPATVGRLRPFAVYQNRHPNTGRYSPVAELLAVNTGRPESGTSLLIVIYSSLPVYTNSGMFY